LKRGSGFVKAAPGLRLGQVGAKRVGFAAHQRLATERAPRIAGQRIDKAEPAVPRIIVPALPASRDIKAEKGPADIGHAERRDRPAAQRVVKRRRTLRADHLLRVSAQIGVELRHEPVVPHLVRLRLVQLRVGEMLVDPAPHLQRNLGRQETVDDNQRRACHKKSRRRADDPVPSCHFRR
jgi:hypothetical protein